MWPPWAHRRSSERARRRSSLAPLKDRPFRRFVLSQVFNNLCLWSHRTAQVWLTVVGTDGDPFSVGLVTALQFMPMMLSAFGGGIGDRWNKRSVLLVSQTVAVVGSLVLAWLAMTDHASLPVLGVMAAVLGVTAAVDAPVRLAFPREIVDPALLRSAISLNGVVFQSSRVVGPAVAGVIIAQIGEGAAFLVASGCGVVALALLSLISATEAHRPEAGADGRWRTTLALIRRQPTLLTPLLGALVVGACLANLTVAVPLILDRMPEAGARDFGLLMATIGVGGACGALLASMMRRGQNVRSLNVYLVVYSLITVGTSIMPTVPLLAISLFVGGIVMQFYNTNAITILQDASPLGQHGRVMGVYVVAFFVWAGFGAPLFGLAAGAAGPRPMLAASSVACAVMGLVLLARHRASGAVSMTSATPV